MIQNKIVEIKERLRSTPPGSWKLWEPDEDYFGDDSPTVVAENGQYIAQTNCDGLYARQTMYADAEFIAHAKEDIRFLLEQLEVFFGK